MLQVLFRRATPYAVPLFFAGLAAVQVAPSGGHWVELAKRSGIQENVSERAEVVWHDVLALHPTTPWLRLIFGEAHLEPGSIVRITSLADGDVQTLNAEHLRQWQSSSAYFNGYAVIVELIAGARTSGNAIAVTRVWAGDAPGTPSPGIETICGSTDNREPSSDARIGRTLTAGLGGGCTAWIINAPATGTDRCHLTAGHCSAGGMTVLQFDVPASSTNCALVHPPASSQYAIDFNNWLFHDHGVGDDYGVFRCFRNSNTNLTTFEAQGAAFTLATSIPAAGPTLRNTGYGVDGTTASNAGGANSSCVCSMPTGARNQVQQTHTGQLLGKSGTTLFHQIDTCGGNSGSPVILESSGEAVAIHTHGGCDDPVGSTANAGTQITAPNLQAAIAFLCVPSTITYATEWKYSGKPDKLSGLLKIAKETAVPFAVDSAGAFSGGLIEEGAWSIGTDGKVHANISQADLQRIVNDLYGSGVATIVAVLDSSYKLKEKLGKNGAPGKVQFSFKVRVSLDGDRLLDIRLKLKGLQEL